MSSVETRLGNRLLLVTSLCALGLGTCKTRRREFPSCLLPQSYLKTLVLGVLVFYWPSLAFLSRLHSFTGRECSAPLQECGPRMVAQRWFQGRCWSLTICPCSLGVHPGASGENKMGYIGPNPSSFAFFGYF